MDSLHFLPVFLQRERQSQRPWIERQVHYGTVQQGVKQVHDWAEHCRCLQSFCNHVNNMLTWTKGLFYLQHISVVMNLPLTVMILCWTRETLGQRKALLPQKDLYILFLKWSLCTFNSCFCMCCVIFVFQRATLDAPWSAMAWWGKRSLRCVWLNMMKQSNPKSKSSPSVTPNKLHVFQAVITQWCVTRWLQHAGPLWLDIKCS